MECSPDVIAALATMVLRRLLIYESISRAEATETDPVVVVPSGRGPAYPGPIHWGLFNWPGYICTIISKYRDARTREQNNRMLNDV